MKKALCLLVLLVMVPFAALGEGVTLSCPFDETTPQGELAAALGALLGAQTRCMPDDMATQPLNAMLADSSVYCLHTNEALIRSLQGYTDSDLRQGMQAVCQVAQDTLYLAATPEAAQEAGLTDLASVADYLAQNEYALMLARLMDASAEDYAATELLNALTLDQMLFVDDADLSDNMEGMPLLLIADTNSAKALEAKGCVVLGALSQQRTKAYPELPCAEEAGIPVYANVYYGVFASSGADIAQVREALEAVRASQAWLDALSACGLEAPALSYDAFKTRVEDDFAAYVDYMTAEGLFFYEE